LDEVVAYISARFADHQQKSLMLHHVQPNKIVASSASFDDIRSVVDRYASFLNNSVAVIHTEYLLFTFLNETGCLNLFTFSDKGNDLRNIKTSYVGHTLLTLRLYNLVSRPNGNFV